MFEWIHNSTPLKELLNREYKEISGDEISIDKNYALRERINWLDNLPDCSRKSMIEKHKELLKMNESIVVTKLKEHQSLIPRDLLKRGLERICVTPESFLQAKNK